MTIDKTLSLVCGALLLGACVAPNATHSKAASASAFTATATTASTATDAVADTGAEFVGRSRIDPSRQSSVSLRLPDTYA
jgi:hypothetical protein